jgi:hypothetical protein
MSDCTGAAKPILGSEFVGDDEPTFGDETKYIFVRLSVLREYLRKDLVSPSQGPILGFFKYVRPQYWKNGDFLTKTAAIYLVCMKTPKIFAGN